MTMVSCSAIARTAVGPAIFFHTLASGSLRYQAFGDGSEMTMCVHAMLKFARTTDANMGAVPRGMKETDPIEFEIEERTKE
jgi:hypothetical protein